MVRKIGRSASRTSILGACLLSLVATPAIAQSERPSGRQTLRFSIASLDADAQPISAATDYSTDRGYGFDLASKPRDADGDSITGDAPLFFSARVPEGNYRVTVTLGDARAASQTTVRSEVGRLMFADVRTEPGQRVTRTFIANVRRPTLPPPPTNAPGRSQVHMFLPGEAEGRHWDDKLTIEFNGPRPHVSAIEIAPADDVPTIFIAGDSTVGDPRRGPGGNWPTQLCQFLKPDVAVSNGAEGGETSKSFITGARFDKVMSQMKPGDFFLIQFGHNDSKQNWPQTYTDPATSFRAYLKVYVEETRRRGGTIVFVTPMERRANEDSVGPWARAMREVAAIENVPVIDQWTTSKQLWTAMGANVAAAFTDQTHLSGYGGYLLSKNIVSGIRQNVPALARFIVDDFKPLDLAQIDPPPAYLAQPAGPGGRSATTAPATQADATTRPSTAPASRPVVMAGASAGNPPFPAVVRDESPERQAERLRWFREARFGMFIHWGVYAVPAGSYGGRPVTAEWIMHRARIPVAEYRTFANDFTASQYDPKAWAALAREAGMKYVVVTAKHHEGFALFDSQFSDWNAVKASGAKRDLIAPLAEAVRGEGLKFGCYYSQSQDWINPGGSTGLDQRWDAAQAGSFDDYLKNVALPQVREIVEKFRPDILWWDTEYQMTPERARPFFDLVLANPAVIHNSRLGGGVLGDFRTSEQRIPSSATGGRALEVNMTLNDSWGYRADDVNWKSSRQLIRNLSNVASLGGNYLLNVGPTKEGVIPEPCVERLRAIGRWMSVNGEAIYGTERSPFAAAAPWGRATVKAKAGGGTTLYLHVWEWPADGRLVVAGLKQKPAAARLLAGAAAIDTTVDERGLSLTLPAQAPDPDVSIVAFDFPGAIDVVAPTTAPTTAPTARP